ncbi:phosphoserine phosphatase serb [Nadsonia fulvescens var. elongata DSM 6958]|uniref:phosphoserine phosphatase n=1 Tax=Nadsonia fulvescens var. elongata DSM 6958 TaxID=857566 RepID=A0A1E3PPR2_9ASCO|nr:phosphoserine phosphatase serb [Nadsonia fulvescens var. elongata DSM 6958]
MVTSSLDYVCTLIAPTDKPGFSEEFINAFFAVLTASAVAVNSTRILSKDRAVDYDIQVSASEIFEVKISLFELSNKAGIDIVFQPAGDARRSKGLVVFDMDSTLIQQEVIDMIAAYANVEEEVSKITAAAMNGEIDFNQSLSQRVGLLAGIPSTVFESLKSQIVFTPGARQLTHALNKLGVKTAVLSGGFIPLAKWVQAELGLDYAHANTLEISEDGTQLTGRTLGTVVNGHVKGQLLEEIATKENLDLSRTVAVGDGSNDLIMMGVAGFGVAFNAKPAVQEKAPSKLNTESLLDILYIFGYNDEEITELIN